MSWRSGVGQQHRPKCSQTWAHHLPCSVFFFLLFNFQYFRDDFATFTSMHWAGWVSCVYGFNTQFLVGVLLGRLCQTVWDGWVCLYSFVMRVVFLRLGFLQASFHQACWGGWRGCVCVCSTYVWCLYSFLNLFATSVKRFGMRGVGGLCFGDGAYARNRSSMSSARD